MHGTDAAHCRRVQGKEIEFMTVEEGGSLRVTETLSGTNLAPTSTWAELEKKGKTAQCPGLTRTVLRCFVIRRDDTSARLAQPGLGCGC